MSEPYIGEIRMFAGNFAPAGWMMCMGQTLAISENDTLFNLIGTTYGGDGQQTFNLPNLQSRIPIHQGSGAGLTPRTLAETGGAETVTVTVPQLPAHTHVFAASTTVGSQSNPANNVPAQAPAIQLYIQDTSDSKMSAASVTSIGGSQPHDNLMPYICINYIISLYGIYPSQS